MELLKNDKIEATIESLGYRGEGVARIDRVPVFIDGALPGEKVRAVIILVKKDFAIGKLLEVLSPSADRVEPHCPYFMKCGGCNLQHLAYAKQREFKHDAVQNALKKVGNIETYVGDCVGSSKDYGYRNKLSLPVRAVKGSPAVGLYAYNSHRIIEIDSCPLQTEQVNALLPQLKRMASAFMPFDEEANTGEIKHFVVRDLNGRLSVCVVTRTDISAKIKGYLSKNSLIADEVWININPKNSNVIMGDKTLLIAGQHTPYDVMGLSVSVHPKGFLQVNQDVMRALYAKLIEKVTALDPSCIIDAYSGAGLLTTMLSDYSKQVIGVEIVSEAVESANALAKSSGKSNIKNICGDCAKVLPDLLKDKPNSLVVLDPPRSGCDASVISAVNTSNASSVIYISCNPSTLARDLRLLDNYLIDSVTPFDMFPQTYHVETLVTLSLKK